jgi:hypothetical protein
MTARLSFNTACELGFGGSLDEVGAPHGEPLRDGEPTRVEGKAWVWAGRRSGGAIVPVGWGTTRATPDLYRRAR